MQNNNAHLIWLYNFRPWPCRGWFKFREQGNCPGMYNVPLKCLKGSPKYLHPNKFFFFSSHSPFLLSNTSIILSFLHLYFFYSPFLGKNCVQILIAPTENDISILYLYLALSKPTSSRRAVRCVKKRDIKFTFFKLRAETNTSTLGLLTGWLIDSLTDWLICPHNALKNLAKVEKSYFGQTLRRFQAASLSTLLRGNNLRILLRRIFG